MQAIGDMPGSGAGVAHNDEIQVVAGLVQQAVAQRPSHQVNGKFGGEKCADLRQAGEQIERVGRQRRLYSGGW